MRNSWLKLLLVFGVLFSAQQKAEACHAIALVNFTQQNVNANSIDVTAASDSPTCGCATYWLDVEVRCLNEPFDAAPFNPGFWGPLGTYPYFQSAQMNKPNCTVQNYPWVNIPFAGLCPGMTYQYRMRENHNGAVGPWCPTQTFVVPGATAPLVINAITSNQTICAGDCVTLTGSVVSGCGLAATYTWDNGAGTGASVNVCPAATTTYTLTVQEQCSGFTDQASVTVTIVPPPVPGVANLTTPAVQCGGNPVNINLTGSQGTIQWESAPNAGGPWTPMAGETGTTLNVGSLATSTCYQAAVTGCAPLPAGSQTVYSNVVCVTVDPAPTADFTYISACGGNATVFNDASLTNGGSAIATWAWDFGDGNTSNQQNPSHSYAGPGPFNVTLTVTNASGCQHTVVLPVNTDPSPIANFNFTPACGGAPSTFTDASNGNGGTINQWNWDFGDGNTSTQQNPSNSYAASGNYNVTLTVTTTAGCTDQVVIPITVPEDPVANFNASTGCLGTPTNFTDASTVGGGSTITGWNWDFGDGNTSTAQNPNNTYGAAGNYNVTLTVTTNDGCTDQIVLPIQVFEEPTANFNFVPTCGGNPTTFTDASVTNGGSAITTWFWDFDDGNTSNQQNPSNIYVGAGPFNVSLTVTNADGCSNTVVIPVNAAPSPIANFNVTPACPTFGTTFTDASNGNGGTINQWDWDFGDGNTSTAQNPTNNYAAGGNYNVTLTVTTTAGCVNQIVIPIQVPEDPVVAFNMASVCEGTVGTFTDVSTVGGGSTITGWNWDMGDGNTYTTQVVNHSYATSSTYNVTLTVTTSDGCVGTLVQPVTIYADPIANFSPTTVCQGAPTVFNDLTNPNGATLDTWNWDILDDGSVEYNTLNPTHTFPTAGTYDVELMVNTINGCADSVVLQVTVDPAPVPDFTFAVACEGAGTAFTDASAIGAPGNITGWQWDFGDGNTSTAQNPTNAYTGFGSYQVQLIATSADGCVDSITYQVDVPDVPVAEFTMSNVCDGTIGTFFDASTVGAPGAVNTWNWDMGDGNIFGTQNVSHAYATNGTYNVTLTVTTADGCTDDTTMAVTIFPNPTADFTFGAACSGNASALNDNSNGNGGTITQWDWDILDDGSVEYTAQNPNHVFAGTGTYNVELVVTTLNGCADSVVLPVTVDAPPVANFNVTNICETGNAAFTDASNVAVGAIVGWEWDFDNGNTSIQQNPTETYPTENVYNVELVVTSDLGCTDTIVQALSVFPNPVADFTPQAVCFGEVSQFMDISTVSVVNTANVIDTWAWDFGNGNTSTAQNPAPFAYAAPGQYNVQLTVTTDNGCSGTLTVPVDVWDPPTADFTFNDDCIDQTSPFTDASTIPAPGAITSWSWDFNGDGIEDDNTQNPTFQFPAAGTYNVTLISGSGLGCADTITYPITMFPMPVANFATGPECVYDSAVFVDMSNVGAPSNIVSHVWSFGDGSPLSGNQNPSHLYGADGSYNVQLIVTTGDGCVDDVTLPIQIFPQPTASFTATAECENEGPTAFNNTSSITSGAISSYSWDFDDGNATSVPSPTHSYGMDGVYNVQLIAVSDFGCEDTVVVPVTVLAAPTASFSADATDGCPVFCPQFLDQSLSNATSITNWQWDLGDGTTSNNQHPTNCYDNQGNSFDLFFDVGLIVTNDLGCSDTLNIANYITVHPVPIADFVADPAETDEHNPVVNFTNLSQGGATYDWDFGGNGTSTDVDPSHFFSDTGTFHVTLTAYSAFGCPATVTYPVVITPVPTIYVPNTFTPDGDGTNDIFLPMLYGHETSQYELYIFDRWGQIVFESYSPNVGWDGNVKGGVDNSKTDVFVWKIVLRQQGSGDKKEYVGHVTLLK